MSNHSAVIITNNRGDYSPTVYIHWQGERTIEFLGKARKRMRRGDVSYSCARFIGTMHRRMPGVLGLGVWSNDWQAQSRKAKAAGSVWQPQNDDIEEQSPGDEGVYLYNCSSGLVTHWNPLDDCKPEIENIGAPEGDEVAYIPTR